MWRYSLCVTCIFGVLVPPLMSRNCHDSTHLLLTVEAGTDINVTQLAYSGTSNIEFGGRDSTKRFREVLRDYGYIRSTSLDLWLNESLIVAKVDMILSDTNFKDIARLTFDVHVDDSPRNWLDLSHLDDTSPPVPELYYMAYILRSEKDYLRVSPFQFPSKAIVDITWQNLTKFMVTHDLSECQIPLLPSTCPAAEEASFLILEGEVPDCDSSISATTSSSPFSDYTTAVETTTALNATNLTDTTNSSMAASTAETPTTTTAFYSSDNATTNDNNATCVIIINNCTLPLTTTTIPRQLTEKQKQELIRSIYAELVVPPKTLSLFRRRYESISDPRMSSAVMGGTAILFICLTVGVTFLLDVTACKRHLQAFKGRF